MFRRQKKEPPAKIVPIDYDDVGQPVSVKRVSLIALVLGLCMVGVVLISQLVLVHKSIRLDESQSLWQSSHSLGGLLYVVAQDVHVPLYHLILHFWILYFGSGIEVVRLLSLLFFLATIPLVYALGRQVLKTGWALFAAALFSFSPFMNWYGNEARMYTMLAFFATLSQYYFLRLLQRRKVWFRYGLVAVVGVYSHYFFSFNLAIEGLFYLFNRKKFAPGTFKRLVIVAILTIASLLPWLLYFHSLGSGQNTSPHLARPTTVDFFNVYSQFLFGFQDVHINTILVSLWPLLMLVAFFAVRREQKATPQIGFIAMMAFVPVVASFALSYVVQPFFISRYMVSSLAPLLILIVWLISHYGRKLAIVAAAVLLLLVIPTSYQQDQSIDTPVYENYRGAAQIVSAEATTQDIVVLSTPFTIYPFEYYYNGKAAIQTLPLWNRQSSGAIPAFDAKTLPAQVAASNKNHRYVYLLLSYNQGNEETIHQYYLHHFPEVSVKHLSPDMNLYKFKVGYYTVPAIGTPTTQLTATQAAGQ